MIENMQGQNLLNSAGHYVDARKNKLIHYSKYWSYLNINQANLWEGMLLPELSNILLHGTDNVIVESTGHTYIFLVERAGWESGFFKRNIYKIKYVLYGEATVSLLSKAIAVALDVLKERGCEYCYLEIPSEDNLLIQAYCESSFKVVETRLYYYNNKLQDFPHGERSGVRMAETQDIPSIRKASMLMRNEYDRVHSEVFFDKELADQYLAAFAEECVKGFADYTIVPNEGGLPAEAFFATNYNQKDWDKTGAKIGQFALAAVLASTCRGWYGKLLSEICIHMKGKGIDGVITITQSTNKAVIHTYEKFGFKYGHTSLILSKIII